MNLANGSPGSLIKHLKTWKEIPEDLWPNLVALPTDPIKILTLARDITETLDLYQQIWLIQWLHIDVWGKSNDSAALNKLEKLRSYLNSFISPRLAWEVTLIELLN